ncbi:lipid-A-disaccharide synthase [Parapusillimonas granuli]|uniref:Lipid-A-disaccharide synthase n=1 Tax=Parapusillimonas granuli TaxID=380911 RepID=A0A853G016_9BURK|nr:lipid-A-disaccharide synthase [Parapusillimonas granuli]MBB5214137.1 lipid-A-disaccharide synthase [Parapusillimonas granuli]NYT50558.1 lipid-A-disaccharide synthase [Parapusillimonas granuli]
MTLRLGMVAGEPSGDLLAARIMQGVRQRVSPSHYEGIGGPAMRAEGLDAWHDMRALTVFGYVDAFKRLPSLLHTYFDVKKRWLSCKPDVFVGIDAPDFNLRLELQLKQAGVPTVHFVGPSIWAWRYERIHKIRAAVSHMLVLFPFEEEIYQKEGVPVTYVGHPLAQVIPMRPDQAGARRYLGVDGEARVLAVMPGSRSSEIRLLAPRFLQAAQLLARRDPALQILVPMVNGERRLEFEAWLRRHPVPNCRIIDGGYRPQGAMAEGESAARAARPAAWNVMEAADAVLVASGTATLEAALFKRPMVISYVLSPTMRRMMEWKSGQARPYVPWVGLPNVLARDFVVPELLQEAATPQALADAAWKALTDTVYGGRVAERFTQIHESLNRDTPALAARAIVEQLQHGTG